MSSGAGHTSYSKLSGGGNDFIALAEPAEEPSAARIAGWCRRGTSEGADGLFILDRTGNGVRMRHFNSDGLPAALCLNGTRCAARLAFELGWANDSTRVETAAGTFAAREAGDDEVELELEAPRGEPRPHTIALDDREWAGWRLEVGVPHLVLLWDRPMGEAPVATVGRTLRSHPSLGPAGANVDFVAYPGRHEMRIRTFERGVEAETLACGTGVLAATVLALAEGFAALPIAAMTKGGFSIVIDATQRAGFWSMRGDARLVAQGTLARAAEGAPEEPGW